MYTLTLITRTTNNVTPLLKRLNDLDPAVPFAALHNDEIQGVFAHPEEVYSTFALAARDQNFWIGIGVGEVKVPRLAGALGAVSTAECSGEGLQLSRRAVELARTGMPVRSVAVCADDQGLAENLTGMMRLLYRVIAKRSVAENRVIDLLIPGVRGQTAAVAQALGITSQAVSRALNRASWHEEIASRAVVYRLLKQLNSGLIKP
ncbi:recombinase RecJ [Rothia sp. ZJ1223]|uniref:recombinase RecJ n=1 Tax=Rothia sp. ZJ1223 TaxID=2811098 RepID=UPI00195A24EA|nr:recombinase RecJ [Rothia sp. ZJ1223]MBM7051624.1 recombinase RecJ [Rothia sp. ZJ1223]